MKNKKAIIVILFLSLLATLACQSRYAALQETPPTASPTLPEAKPTMTMQAPATDIPSMVVCTGVEHGALRVRNAPGIEGKVLFILNEDDEVYMPGAISKIEVTPDGATWIKITFKGASGWVNKRFLCEAK